MKPEPIVMHFSLSWTTLWLQLAIVFSSAVLGGVVARWLMP